MRADGPGEHRVSCAKPCGFPCFHEENVARWHEPNGQRRRLRAITRKTPLAVAVCHRNDLRSLTAWVSAWTAMHDGQRQRHRTDQSCRPRLVSGHRVEWHYIALGKPQQNGFIDSFNSRLRD